MAKQKREEDQVRVDRARIAELLLQHYTHQEIATILFQETGIKLSRRQITYDAGKIRSTWLKKQNDSYESLVNQELARLDALETEIWRAMRASTVDRERKTIEEIARRIREAGDEEDEDRFELAVAKVFTTVEKGLVNPAYFDKIMELHKERRRLLGLYPATNSKVDINERHEIVIKGYGRKSQGEVVSPDDWPDIVDGDFEPQKALPENV